MYNRKLKVNEEDIKREEGIELLYEEIKFTKLELSYNDISSFPENLSFLKNEDGKYEYIDKNGNTVILSEFEDTFPIAEELTIIVETNGRTILIDKQGEEVKIPISYKNISSLGDNLFFLTDSNDKQYLMKYTLKKEKISNKDLNTNDIEKLKVLLSKIRNAKQIKLYYDLIFNGKVLTFDTLEKRNDADGTGPDIVNNLRVKTNNLDSANYQLRARNYQLEKLFNTSGKYSVNNLLNKIDRLTKENVMLSFENKQLKKRKPHRYY